MIIVNLDVMMAKRKISSIDLADKIGITPANLSVLKTNKGKAIRFSTLNKLCKVLDCMPGDILEYQDKGEEDMAYNTIFWENDWFINAIICSSIFIFLSLYSRKK